MDKTKEYAISIHCPYCTARTLQVESPVYHWDRKYSKCVECQLWSRMCQGKGAKYYALPLTEKDNWHLKRITRHERRESNKKIYRVKPVDGKEPVIRQRGDRFIPA